MLRVNQLLRVHSRCSVMKKTLTCPVALSTQRRFATSSISSGFFKATWSKYERLLESHPIATKVGTACGIAAAGDINCQVFIEKDKLSLKRVAVFTFLGGIMVPPILHVWYKFLGRFASGITTQAILKRLTLDQLGFAPVFLPIFFSTLLTLEGVPEMIPSKLEQDWWPAVKANWVVWVPAQFINFRFVPGHLQVLFANIVGLFWNSYLSYISHAITDEIVFETTSHDTGIVIAEQEESILTA